MVEGAGPRHSVVGARNPSGGSRGREYGLYPHPSSIPDSSVALGRGTKRAAEALGRREPAPHAEGAREGASCIWGCTWTCRFCCKQTARSGGRGVPRSPPTHRGPRQAVYLTPATETPRCVVGLTVGQGKELRRRSHGTSLKHNVAHFYFISEKTNRIIFPSEGKAVREGLCPGSSEPPRLTPAGRP